jgi:hypothetical protein
MRTPKESDWPKNRLAIVTFNYDRSVEHFFLTALQNTYGLELKDAQALLGAIPIVHVHGQLGERGARPYSHTANKESVHLGAAGIKIIHEGVYDSREFQHARALLHEYKVVCFLGFGYNPTNLRRLRVDKLQSNHQVVFGTALGELADKYARIVEAFRPTAIQLGAGGDDALRFLQNYSVFR